MVVLADKSIPYDRDKPKVPEALVLKGCLQWLAMKGIFAYRINSGAVQATYKGIKRFIRFNTANGIADIAGILRLPCGCGEALYIECKSTIGQLTTDQREFRETVRGNGALWILARSSDDLEKPIEEFKQEHAMRHG